ncbi:CesT family type III secretion system chaperone [Bordetella bronchiseptica]|uniref:CesT family type III secretion system chaperone n=1 Tax=Bordetella bronchiseptica TaxID=518 RepID=UPI00028F8B49|nr:CesT family type III secretion system chaperone [Bordetella bronchiseptica]AUL14832.1 Tir chaperone family protein [Bordetella bronchiseptica]AWP57928.1 Tir chaperone family protein [Bordetella bronchiseptica]AZW30226.1 Tir chaperone family protein [Bordetella bronchiseptica]QIY02344.1 CesT family type III secretion system chaperone [Bordetella bronchiseptica]RSC00080.1 CesT family type III secretion system chaperone [Bordetella bronchiseptica]
MRPTQARLAMTDTAYHQLIADFGRLIGIDSLNPGAGGLCQLIFEPCAPVFIAPVHARAEIMISCVLGTADAANPASMARANFMQAGSGVVACIGGDGLSYLQQAIPLSRATPAILLDHCERLLQEASRWRVGDHDVCATSAPNIAALTRGV